MATRPKIRPLPRQQGFQLALKRLSTPLRFGPSVISEYSKEESKSGNQKMWKIARVC